MIGRVWLSSSSASSVALPLRPSPSGFEGSVLLLSPRAPAPALPAPGGALPLPLTGLTSVHHLGLSSHYCLGHISLIVVQISLYSFLSQDLFQIEQSTLLFICLIKICLPTSPPPTKVCKLCEHMNESVISSYTIYR